MRVRKTLRVWAVWLTFLLAGNEIVMHEAFRKPVEIPIAMTANAEVTTDFWIFISGEYTLDLVFNKLDDHARARVKRVLGSFACWNIKTNSPCGEYSPYSIRWEIRSSKKVIVSGVGSEKTRGRGHSAYQERGEQLGGMNLPVGRLTLHVVVEEPLPQLADLSSRLVLSGGTGGALVFQSFFVTYAWILWVLGRYILWYVVGLLWVLLAFMWFRSKE